MIEELIAKGRYEDALNLLKDTTDENKVYQRILCLYSLKRLNEARMECEILLEYAQKNYYDVIAIYVSILIEMNDLDTAKKVLEEELEMPYIPGKYEKIFNETYDELLKKGKEDSKTINVFDTLSDDDLSNEILICNDKEIMFMLLQQLENRNIRKLIPCLKEFLLDSKKERIFKTIIIEALANQNVNSDFKLVDENEEIIVNPSKCATIMELDCIEKILKLIETLVNNQDISFLQYCGEVLMSYVGNIYPNNIEEKEYNIIACSIIIYVESLINGDSSSYDSLLNDLKLDENEIENMLNKLEKIMIL